MSGSTGDIRHRSTASKRKEPGDRGARRHKTLQILLVDPRPWTREGLARALETGSRDLTVLRFGEAAELAKAEQRGDTLVLLNLTGIELSDPSATTSVSAVRAHLPGVPVVALSHSENAEEILGAIEQGLNGYVPISLELRSVVDALCFIAAGGTFVPAEPLLAGFHAELPPGWRPQSSLGDVARAAMVTDTAAATPALNALTPREHAVLDRLRQGKSNKEVARELDMREATVKVHVRHIMRKLGASNRTQVALFAEELLG